MSALRQRDIAVVFQNYALYPHMTAGQHRERRSAAPGDVIGIGVEGRLAYLFDHETGAGISARGRIEGGQIATDHKADDAWARRALD